MEQLAMLVLNGEGNKLIGLKSEQPEIQAFLDNVTSYMVRIFAYTNLLRQSLSCIVFRRKYDVFIKRPEMVISEIYNQHWIEESLLLLRIQYHRMERHHYMWP